MQIKFKWIYFFILALSVSPKAWLDGSAFYSGRLSASGSGRTGPMSVFLTNLCDQRHKDEAYLILSDRIASVLTAKCPSHPAWQGGSCFKRLPADLFMGCLLPTAVSARAHSAPASRLAQLNPMGWKRPASQWFSCVWSHFVDGLSWRLTKQKFGFHPGLSKWNLLKTRITDWFLVFYSH